MSRRGFSTLEVFIAIGMASALALITYKVLLSGFKAGTRNEQVRYIDSEAITALEHIVNVGIKAKSCYARRATNALECALVTPQGTVDTKRFVFRSASSDVHAKFTHSHLDYEESGNAGTSWSTVKTYGYISGFEMCADEDMRDTTVNPLNPCRDDTKWTPVGISVAYAAAYPAAQDPSRFFRVRVTASQWGLEGPGMKETLQTAFYVRNPTGIDGLQYE